MNEKKVPMRAENQENCDCLDDKILKAAEKENLVVDTELYDDITVSSEEWNVMQKAIDEFQEENTGLMNHIATLEDNHRRLQSEKEMLVQEINNINQVNQKLIDILYNITSKECKCDK